MTNTAPLDCPTIVATYDDDTILSTVQNFLYGRQGWKANMTYRELFILAWACYGGTRIDGQMTVARAEGDHGLFVVGRVLPCYMGSWFIEARKGQ